MERRVSTLAADAVVGRAPLFHGLAPEAVLAITDSLHYTTYFRGEAIYSEGDLTDELFIIVSGKAKISRTFRDGRETVLAIMGPSDMFGELSLLDPGPRTTTARAMTDLSVGVLARSSLRPWIADQPEMALQLLQMIARRLRRMNDARSDLIFTNVPVRLAKELVELARRFGVAVPDGIRVDHNLTQDELSQLCGTSRETVNKVLREFTDRGWIRAEHQSVTILDEARLIRRARDTAVFSRRSGPPAAPNWS